MRHGLTDSVDFTQESIAEAGKGLKGFVAEDLEQTQKDLVAVGGLFVETLRKVADRSGEVAGNTLHELADDARRKGSRLQEKAAATARTLAERLKEKSREAVSKTQELGSKAAHTVGEEAKELGERMLDVAKGAATGMLEGAKTAFHKDGNTKDKSQQ